MCDEVKIDGQCCETIGQLRRALLPSANIVKSRHYNALPPDEACLCGVDICATLIRSGREEYDHDPGSGRWVVLDEPVAPTSGMLLRSTKMLRRERSSKGQNGTTSG